MVRPQNRTVEQILADLATRAHGVVTRHDLVRAGITTAEVKSRLRAGALIRVHRGVYRVGHVAPSTDARYLAAAKACGDGAALSGRAAGHLLGLLKAIPAAIEVSAPRERRIPGITTRRCRKLGPADITHVRAIPVTTVPRTLVDLAADLDEDALARACHEAGVRYATAPQDVESVLSKRPTTPGAGKLRRIMSGDARVTLSGLERRFLALLREEGLPLPITNRRYGSWRVDCRWPDRRLTVELDSYRFHNSRHSWERDRRREREARARGDEFRRYGSGDVFDQPRLMLRELVALLA